ncbi:MAG: HAD hydrolase-like protein, partial [Acidimicrobiia bacterium]
ETALGALRAMGVRICLTTGFSRPTREQIIDVLGWRDLIDLSLSPEPGIRGRPYPDLILTALMRLDVESVRSVAVAGDTTSDVVSGHRAGARVVAGVLSGAHDRIQLAEASPTHILASIDELPGVLGRLSLEG